MKTILVGTTNPSKAAYFRELLSGCDVRFATLQELSIAQEPVETGATPEENARIKAAFYGKYADYVLCADSGLYFDALDLADPRQPGLSIRTPGGCARLDDEQMIAHYAQIVHHLGGRMLAYYLDGAAVYACGEVYGFQATREEAMTWAFYMTDKPSQWRREGWPLDTLSVALDGKYFLDPSRPRFPQATSGYRPRLRAFLMDKLGL
ncbi:MAG: non-canonical purine NTP pyrophosphatase [Clostridia bacterium]|nr:non-canonical purine NTP pyrophosphatase [Clostridia bacterium]